MDEQPKRRRGGYSTDDIERDPSDPLDFLFDSEVELPPESVGITDEDRYIPKVTVEETHKKINRALGDPEFREELRKERAQHKQWHDEWRQRFRERTEDEK